MNRLVFLCTSLLLIAIIKLQAQAPKVTGVFPQNQTIHAAADAEIIVTFEAPVDPASVDAVSFKAFGRWSGPASGTVSFENNNTELHFSPDEPFFAGEWVTISLSKGIRSASSENLEKGYSWNYWIATTAGTLNQVFIEKILLELPGEGWIETYGAYAGDLNNDGYSDLTVVNENSDDLRILLNDGQGNYPAMQIHNTGQNSPSPNEGADFNNDGQIDFAVSTSHDHQLRVLMGNGQGNYSSMETYQTGQQARGLAVGDFNGDGWDDIFITNRISGNLSLFLNDGDGTFSSSTLNTPGNGESACAVTDANNDGIPDVFVGMFGSREIGLLLGDGEGGFSLSGMVNVLGQPWMITAGDVNGDGNADVVSANSTGNVTAVVFGDGEGGLSAPDHYSLANATFQLAIDLGDLDGDGDLDMLTSNYSSATYTVFENDGNGIFSVADLIEGDSLASCAILHDRDNDGDLDISLTDEGKDLVLLYENFDPFVAVSEVTTVNKFDLTIYPNPLSATSTIQYSLSERASVRLAIYDLSGRELRLLANEKQTAGAHQISWNGKDFSGQKVTSGVYVLSLDVNGEKVSKTMSVK